MLNGQTPHALLFDLDGTLIDSIQLLLESMEYAFSGRRQVPSRAEWIKGIGTPLRTQLAAWCKSDLEVEELVARYRVYQDEYLERLTTLYPAVPDVLAWAREKGHPTAIVTSKGRTMTARSLGHIGLTSAFDCVVTWEETTRHKPDPDPVLLALDQLGVPAGRALFVGDSPHDMYAGHSAGVKTAAALWGPFSQKELDTSTPDFWLSSISELPSVIKRLP